MKSETNMGIKSYRNAEVNGMECNLCKDVEVLGTKAHQCPAWLNMKHVFGKNLGKKRLMSYCDSKGRWTADEEQRPSHNLTALALFSYSFS